MTTRRIVILGFMACGKTTVGEEVAQQLNCGFVDLDSFISEREARSPAEIIMENGEAVFRKLETLALRDVLQDTKTRVIALGGGTWTVPANRTLVALHDCLSVWLDAPFELCWERILRSKTFRPLAPNRKSAKVLFDARRADYQLASNQLIQAGDKRPRQLAKTIIDSIAGGAPP